VLCNYDVASSTDICAASVGDAGTPPAVAPTGIVKFSGSAPGAFAAGSTCTLVASPSTPTVSSCSIQFYTSGGTVLPGITVTYGGDSQHSPSFGKTHYLGASPSSETSNQSSPPVPGRFPNEILVETRVPANGSTVQACLVPGHTQGSAASIVGDIGKTIGDIAKAIGKVNDPAVEAVLKAALADLTKTEGVASALQGLTPVQLNAKITGSFAQRANTDIAKALSDLHLSEGDLQGLPTGGAGQQNAQQVLKDMQQTLDKLTGLVRQQEAATCGSIDSTRGAAPRAAIAATHKGKLVHLAYALKRNLPAGPLKLKLRLNGARLERLAGKRNQVTLNVRINMVLPARVLHGGDPVTIVKRITLKRGAAKTHAVKQHASKKHKR
jgi:hypothetical protein